MWLVTCLEIKILPIPAPEVKAQSEGVSGVSVREGWGYAIRFSEVSSLK